MPTLYTFRRCPYAMRARLALVYAQQQVVLREVSLKEKPTHLLHHSPKGTVPVLLLDDGLVLEESLDIMKWALSKNDPKNWLENFSNQEALINQNDQLFKPKLDRYKYADRHQESALFYRQESLNFPLKLNELLARNKYLFGDSIRIADIAIFPFIRQYAHVDIDWFESFNWPHLNRWLTEFKASELFDLAMKKVSPWKEGDEIIYFP